jgi:hypothetical protein
VIAAADSREHDDDHSLPHPARRVWTRIWATRLSQTGESHETLDGCDSRLGILGEVNPE